MKVLSKLGASFDRIINSAAVVSEVLIVLLMIGVTANVTGRSFGSPILGMEEISEYFLLWLTFFATAWVLRDRKHVIIDIISNKFSPRAQTVFNIIIPTIGAVMFLFISWSGAVSCWDYIQRGVAMAQVLRLNKGIVWAVIPAGSLLLSIQFLRDAYNGFRSLMRR